MGYIGEKFPLKKLSFFLLIFVFLVQATAFASFHVCENQQNHAMVSQDAHHLHTMDVQDPTSQVDHSEACQCDSVCTTFFSTLIPNAMEFTVAIPLNGYSDLYKSRFFDSTYSVALKPPKTA